MCHRTLCQFFYLFCLLFSNGGCLKNIELLDGDVYNEELFISRLKNEMILSQFRFSINTGEKLGPFYRVFPRIIGEVINNYDINELHFSLTQGFWRTDEWGFQPQPSSPSGALLYAWFRGNDTDSVSRSAKQNSHHAKSDRWTSFVNSLNGIFCTSLLQMIPVHTAAPKFVFKPRGYVDTDSFVKYGALSGENVCTENLTPWRKLLPCKETGLSTLLNPVKLYGSKFHSMSVHAFRTCEVKSPSCKHRWNLELILNVVADVDLTWHSLDWRISTLFGRTVDDVCSVSSSTVVIFERDRKSVQLSPLADVTMKNGRSYYVYHLESLDQNSFPFNLHARYRAKLDLSRRKSENLVSMNSYLGGTDQQSGNVVNTIINRQNDVQQAVYMHVIPWYMRVYFHTVNFECRELDSQKDRILEYGVLARNFVIARDRGRPFLLEWNITLPARSICELSFEFDKAFLRVSEHPPDANHGLYASAGSLTFLPKRSTWFQNRTALGGYYLTALQELMTEDVSSLETIVIYGEALLVSLPVPDFSMPFNVMCLVCTVIAMLFGPIHSLTTKIMFAISKEDDDLAPKSLLHRFYLWLLLKYKELVDRWKNFKEKHLKEDDNVDDRNHSNIKDGSTSQSDTSSVIGGVLSTTEARKRK